MSRPDDENQPLVAVVVTPRIFVCMSFAIYIFYPVCYIILVTLAGFSKGSIEEWSSFTQANVALVTSLLISAGSLGIIFMVFGFCCKSVEFMKLMGVLVPILLILQIIAVVYGCIEVADKSNYLQKTINHDMKAEFNKYSSSEDVQERFNMMQNEKECCGVYGVKDYVELKITIPISCCSVSDNMNKYCPDEKLAFQKGCSAKLYQDIINNIAILSYVTIGLVVLQIILGGCLIKMLVRTVRNDD